MTLRATLVAALASCSSHAITKPPIDAASGCAADFTGNFTESSTSPSSCPTLDGSGTLSVAIPSTTLGSADAISIALGPSPEPGDYSSDTIADWSAYSLRIVGDGGCEYSAGGSAVPMGSFTLTLTAAAPHGSLSVTQYVLTEPGTDCGDPDTELLALSF